MKDMLYCEEPGEIEGAEPFIFADIPTSFSVATIIDTEFVTENKNQVDSQVTT
jgi:hypothetical protein